MKFTANEDAIIIRERKAGKTYREIAKLLARTKGSVESRGARLLGTKGLNLVGHVDGEDWRVIKDFPDYAVSNLGRVCNLKTGVVLSPTENTQGYLKVSLYRDRKLKTHVVHRLVAEAFISRPDKLRDYVNHKDGNKKNNSKENLEWVLPVENTKHAIDTGLMDVNRGEQSHLAKLDDRVVHEICRRLKNGESQMSIWRSIKDTYKVSVRAIGFIKQGQTWKHISKLYL